jgi:hypothetical protein
MSKKYVFCFCMWSIYFSTNFDGLFYFMLPVNSLQVYQKILYASYNAKKSNFDRCLKLNF